MNRYSKLRRFSKVHHCCGLLLLLTICLFLLPACGSKYQKPEHVEALGLFFEDPLWDGVSIPLGQQCIRSGGKGATPGIIVTNLPSSANVLIFEYSDQDSVTMDHGGHGILGFHVPKRMAQVTVPPVPGNTFDLPPGFFLIQPHRRQVPALDQQGAYLPPCDGDDGHRFYVRVTAIYDPNPPEPASKGPHLEKILKPHRWDTRSGKRDLTKGKCNPPQACDVADAIEFNQRDIKDMSLEKYDLENQAKTNLCKNIANAPQEQCHKMGEKTHYPEHLYVDPEGKNRHPAASHPPKAMFLAEGKLSLGIYIPGRYE